MSESVDRILSALNSEAEEVTVKKEDLQLITGSICDLSSSIKSLYNIFLEVQDDLVYPYITGYCCSICENIELKIDNKDNLEHENNCYVGNLLKIFKKLNIK